MYGHAAVPLPPSAGPRSRLGLLLWLPVQVVWVPVDTLLRLLVMPFLELSSFLTDGERPDAESLRFALRPLTRWVGPVRLVREWGTDPARRDAHMNRLCSAALRAYGPNGLRRWSTWRYGVLGDAVVISPKDYRGLTAERIHAIAASRGLRARSAGPSGVSLTPTGWVSK
ncbi:MULTISPECIES: hypothetical protein [Kitasatospora]|uniref:Uncharacterized protein n=1 Tax=Kitasatospora cystarginea TaxID=58350 RepID=A0ABP5RFX5_9ACTN